MKKTLESAMYSRPNWWYARRVKLRLLDVGRQLADRIA